MYANMMLSILRRVCTFWWLLAAAPRIRRDLAVVWARLLEFPFRRELLEIEATIADIWPPQFGLPAVRSIFPAVVIG